MTMTQAQVIADNIEKTYRELAAHAKPQARSRISTTSNGYIHLVAWSNASLLRVFVVRFTQTLHKSQYRTRIQVDDAARSTVANIEEGFARPTTREYLNFLGFSQASLIEVKGDVQRLRQDGLLPSRPGSSLGMISVDLGDWHEALKESVISRPPTESEPSKFLQNPLNSFKFLYDPVDNLDPDQLTYEMFIELVNKTDWHLRKLVISLEDKLARDQKFYQVEQARIRGNLSWRR